MLLQGVDVQRNAHAAARFQLDQFRGAPTPGLWGNPLSHRFDSLSLSSGTVLVLFAGRVSTAEPSGTCGPEDVG